MVEMAMTAAGPRRRLRCLIMFVPPNGLNTCWLSDNARGCRRGTDHPALTTTPKGPIYSATVSRAYPERAGSWPWCHPERSGDRQARRCAAAGRGQPWRQSHSQILHPTSKRADAALFVIAERGRVADAAAEVKRSPVPFSYMN